MDDINTEEMFKCKNCKKLIDEPYESECCGSLFCKSCMKDLNYTKCKQCKKTFHFRKNLFAKNLMKKVELKCEHQCGQKFNLEEMKLHLLRCENKLFKCNIDYCYCVEKKKALVEHVITAHTKEILIMMENYEEFKPALDKIINNPNERKSNKDNRNFE